jgi:anti-sigma-K factor RskA
MTDEPRPDGRAALAAEKALRLLAGSEARDASKLQASDPEFASEVARWRGRLAPLLDEVDEVSPPHEMWTRIATATGTATDNVVRLRRSAARWRAAAAGMTALAASLGFLLLQQPRSAPAPVSVQRPAAPPMVAVLGDSDQKMKLVASWDPAARQLVLAAAGNMLADERHSHELWVIPAGGKPRSLGTLPASKQAHMQLADALARLLQQGATIAVSVEPRGGSPTGQPTGPVIASGPLDRA